MSTYKHLTREQRYQIDALLKEGFSQTRIAENLGVHKSTISRELRRNQGRYHYFPAQAHRMALDQRRDKSNPRIAPQTWALVEDRLRTEQWSPEQISGWLKRTHDQSVSHERIYQHVRRDKERGGTLHTHLRCRKRWRKRYGSPQRSGPIAGRVGIEERPAIVEQRQRVGDWEGDTIVGKPGKAVLVSLVERRSRFTLLVKVARRTATEVAQAMGNLLVPFTHWVKTVTLDNGSEFAGHASLSTLLNTRFYFAHPYASWERGLNENTNGLVRQYFPKATDFAHVSDEEVQAVMHKLNDRPRKSLGYQTPKEVFSQACHAVALRR